MLACYMEVNNEKIDEMKLMNNDDLIYAIEELSEAGTHKTFDMDDMCDGLHFLLTDVSALMPVKGNLLSESIVGSEMFAGDEVTDSISYVDYNTAHEILTKLEELDFQSIVAGYDPQKFTDNSIYPAIWLKEDAEDIKKELTETFEALKEFYSDITANDNGLIACIY